MNAVENIDWHLINQITFSFNTNNSRKVWWPAIKHLSDSNYYYNNLQYRKRLILVAIKTKAKHHEFSVSRDK